MLRLSGATAITVLFALLPMGNRTTGAIPAQHGIQHTKTCPTANFVSSGSVLGLPTYFSNLSTQMDNCSWDFGDGSSSTEATPQHTYASPGTYQVRLTVYGNGCTDSFIGTVDVIAS